MIKSASLIHLIRACEFLEDFSCLKDMDQGIHGSEEDLEALLCIAGPGWADEDEVEDALNPVEIGELLELPGRGTLLEVGVEGVVYESVDLRLLNSVLLRLLLAVGGLRRGGSQEGTTRLKQVQRGSQTNAAQDW